MESASSGAARMFESFTQAPPDPILGLNDAFKKDTRSDKINLGVGVYQDENGQTPTLACVKRAERLILDRDAAKTYLPIEGSPAYGTAVRELLFGKGSPHVSNGRAITAHAPGGTGALRVAGDLLKQKLGAKKVWLSNPTWANHAAVFQAAGLETSSYPYYDDKAQQLDFLGMKAQLEKLGKEDVVLLHACCHNPTGIDPSNEQWQDLAQVAKKAGFITLFDFAYQGFGEGIEADAFPVRAFAEHDLEQLVCSSFSKNFGLYNERVGALTLFAREAEVAARALSQLKATVRSNYSNPPSHGGAIVATVLTTPDLEAQWRSEVDVMRARIASMRSLFVETLRNKGVTQDFSFIARQKGMFSFAGIAAHQVDLLKEKHAIYAVRSGRINVAGMSESTMSRLCEAVADVLRTA
jgi:aspartate/tyrosine/aromatic aminotransferase